MLTKDQITEIKNLALSHETCPTNDQIISVIETLERYMDDRKLTMRRPPWKCSNLGCDGLIYTITYNDSGVRKGMWDAKCPKCGNEFCT